MEWTKEQQSAIDCREEKSILLAAAAGSGKTAVLVERIISLIKDKKNPMSVSELLVLTFTEAAASEMKRKILRAIKSELEADPENEHLRKQSVLIHSASISTVHAFCNKIIKGHIHLTSYPADYSLATETEGDLLLKQAIDSCLEKYYQRLSLLPSFSELCTAYGSAKGDAPFRELLFNLYKFSKSLPYPYEWLKSSVKNYETAAKDGIKNTVWYPMFEREYNFLVSDITSCYDCILEIVSSLPLSHAYVGFYQAEADLIRQHLSRQETKEALPQVSFNFPTKVKAPKTHPEEEKRIDALRVLAKECMNALKELSASFGNESEELSDKLYLRAKTLKNIVIAIDRKFKKLKKERGLLDFSDLEHGLLGLISDKSHNPTPLALELKSRYREILLDEYQDTNNIQEEIFRLISRDSKNIFMVGDLKQSIYKFRNAVPELFAGKRKAYLKNCNLGRLISLNKNFRSRTEVIDTANFMFSSLMSETLGDIDYNKEEFLVKGASYPDALDNSYETEYYVVPDEDDDSGLTLAEKEAKIIADRINSAVGTIKVYDTNTEKMRPAEYRDIVILLRGRGNSEIIETVLEEHGIPVYSDSGKDYLSSPEVGVIISFLNIIDNPYQDIPLIAVLRSGLFGFTADELAEIRLKKQGCWFYDAVLETASSGFSKAKEFIDELEELRLLSKTSSIYRLILTIYERYNAIALVSSMSFPAQRRANLRLLAQRAMDYEHSNKGNLFGFMNYLDRISEDKKDLSSAKVTSEAENVVRIMTIHKSKGLEFPIVFLSDTCRKFNTKDTSKNINFHAEAGISLAAIDTDSRIKYPSLSASIFAAIQKREILSEEMRLLYVALTRAKEKLIITSPIGRYAKRMANPIYDLNKKPNATHLKDCRTLADWISASLLVHPAAKDLREFYGYDEDIVSTRADFRLKVYLGFSPVAKAAADLPEKESKLSVNAPCVSQIIPDKILDFHTALADKIPVKITVSELKRRLCEDSEYTPGLISSKNIYLKKTDKLSAAEKGTITHFVLQHLNEREISSIDDLSFAINRAEKEGVISAAQKESVDLSMLMAFFESDIGKRLKSAAEVFKEYSFYSSVLWSEIENTSNSDYSVLMQGTIDCFFKEKDGKIILLDYKTDNITADEVSMRAESYKIQIDCYNRAIKDIFGRYADESYIFFLNCAKAVKMF